MKYIFLIIIWVAWFAVHSGLISHGLTERLRKGYQHRVPMFFPIKRRPGNRM